MDWISKELKKLNISSRAIPLCYEIVLRFQMLVDELGDRIYFLDDSTLKDSVDSVSYKKILYDSKFDSFEEFILITMDEVISEETNFEGSQNPYVVDKFVLLDDEEVDLLVKLLSNQKIDI